MPKKSKIVYSDSSKKKHRHLISYKDFKKESIYEFSKLGRLKHTTLFHFFGVNNGFPYKEYKNWFKDDNDIFKKVFTDGIKMYKLIIIQPDGSFYVNSLRNTIYDQEKLTKFKSFKKREKKWQRKYEKLIN